MSGVHLKFAFDEAKNGKTSAKVGDKLCKFFGLERPFRAPVGNRLAFAEGSRSTFQTAREADELLTKCAV